jgi:hypothetical protein
VLTHAAGRLPGLAAALQEAAGPQAQPAVLPADAAARAAHDLAACFSHGDLPRGHLDSALPFLARGPKAEDPDTGKRPSPILFTGF